MCITDVKVIFTEGPKRLTPWPYLGHDGDAAPETVPFAWSWSDEDRTGTTYRRRCHPRADGPGWVVGTCILPSEGHCPSDGYEGWTWEDHCEYDLGEVRRTAAREAAERRLHQAELRIRALRARPCGAPDPMWIHVGDDLTRMPRPEWARLRAEARREWDAAHRAAWDAYMDSGDNPHFSP